ncbi:MMPL family transporter [Curtobacterium flaccumfaciens]|uniref:MMPL family transporter n=1 Tax=Curtobacterium flaccumfaciens TaxID=2035 RepID=UPI001BDF0CBB|nr:MMPL family transporter [Curtobacterium flaccumfaciens]MBT1606806.1 MMPL family transporter [Curtobacterium flaccumfaciens pv. betae]MBT1657886.1 MMPL family transporter [Curtobacterium flaccumfaciens pv. betae]MCS0471829.1 MMPL family transporter [Curtobacterium flaccumfaciens pv. betae]MCS0475195.1 MMPL family transporter [Curtobacterium flaccumfaciens pv. betae]MCS0478242.1 MMPL family transporter [Curtobacterium flaccumfaciens pv. betae]
MAGLLYRLGRFSARRHWLVIITWVAIMAVAGVTYTLFAGTISSSITIPNTKTSQVQDQLADKFPSANGGNGTIVFETKDGKAISSSQQSEIDDFLTSLEKLDGVKGTTSGFATQKQLDEGQKKITDGRATLAANEKKLSDQQKTIDAGKQQIEQAQQQINAQKAQAQALTGAAAAAAQQQIAAGQAKLDAQQTTLESGQQQLNAAAKKLADGKTELDQNADLLDLSKDIRFVSDNGSAAIGTVQFTKSTYEVPADTKTAIADDAESADIQGVNVYVSNDIAQGVPSILGPGEIGGVIIAAIVLLLMLRTVIGAAVPLVSAVLGVGVASLTALSFSSVVEFISVTPVLGVMLGLAVGIDYSLFILNRHRTQLKQGMQVHESIGLANGTSGNAVVFAGATVIVALLALNITGIPFLGLMGTVGAVAVLFAILIATSFTPALLSLIGMRILRKKERAKIGNTDSTRIPNKPMSSWRAVITLVLGVAVLGTIALPATQMRLGLPSGSSEAVESSQYKAYKTLEKEFGAGQNGPLLVVATLPESISKSDVTATEVTIGQAIAKNDDVKAVLPIGASKDRDIIAFQVKPAGGPDSVSTENVVKDLREQTVSTDDGKVTLGVAGNASANIDVSEKLSNVLPLYLVVVVGLSLIILIIVFRSFLVPITATAGFILSVLASFGGLTAIYQFGWLGSVFGVHDPAPILSFLPIIEIGILFGLAMDYQLFLVSGMREAYAHGASAKVAVQRGLHAGRAVVTAAAIIMISVFAGFIFSDSSTIKPIGFGLAFGVLIDAFVVRMLLIPSAMHLLGKSAWWFPKWLDRIVPDVDVEGAKLERTHPVAGHEDTHTGTHALPVEPDANAHDSGHPPAHRA